jgi:hypothetical protein
MHEEAVARARWRAAEDNLYPMLIADPVAYQHALGAVRAVLGELRLRATDLDGLIAAETSAEDVVATACPAGTELPARLLVGAACAMRDRELSTQEAS